MNIPIKNLISEYRRRRSEINKTLQEFRHLHKGEDEDIFSELCFCILTANANAILCSEAIEELKERDLLLKGSAAEIRPILRGKARFHNKKADFIVMARNLLKDGKCVNVKDRLNLQDILDTRNWLVENIKGFGYKEASHFLRNIGLGRDIAILDRHILKNLKKYGVIDKVPASVGSRKIYVGIEDRMRRFSKRVKIPMEALDLLFWSLETGFIFK